MPKASAPSAPCVAVWLSPQTITLPGRLRPCSGPTTCTMPWRMSSRPKKRMPADALSSCSACAIARFSASAMSASTREPVGT